MVTLWHFFSFSSECSLSSGGPGLSTSVPVDSMVQCVTSSCFGPSALFGSEGVAKCLPVYSSRDTLFYTVCGPSGGSSSTPISGGTLDVLVLEIFPGQHNLMGEIASPPISAGYSVDFILSVWWGLFLLVFSGLSVPANDFGMLAV